MEKEELTLDEMQEKALTKMCPFVQETSARQMIETGVLEHETRNIRCKASACMAYCWPTGGCKMLYHE